MAKNMQLQAKKRTIFGKKIKTLRKDGQLPGNIYGGHIASQAIALDAIEFKKMYKQAGETDLIDLQVEGEDKARPTLIDQVQFHPLTREILHVDMRQVNLKEKITATVGVELIGESKAQALGAVIVTLKDELEVEALPTDLPHAFEIDITTLENIGDAITVADLKVDTSKVKVLAEPEEILVKAEAPQAEEAPEPTAEEVPAEGAEGEGEAPAEGETPKPEETKAE
jgi:large subunit ribosomal protein L25